MTYLATHAYLVVLVSLACAAAIGLAGRRLGPFAPVLALPAPVLAALTGAAYLAGSATPFTGAFAWMGSAVPALALSWRLDGLAAVMLVVVGVVASMVMVFSIGYMHGEKGYVRYFALLSLFVAAMSTLVLADDLVALFVGWELVGACSFLLIGFWYSKPSAAEAARKAFLVTRVGDAGFMLGMGLLWATTGSLSLPKVLGGVAALPAGVATAAALLLFVGAMGKSAQMPLHIWLPDAMEGPTPVSALIHAATMVAAGVYLLARTWPLFDGSAALPYVLVVGCVTALVAATIGVTQTDIKKVLAYSTISQLGFMFAALGAGAWPVAMFHLVTHAAFKALLFLAAGSVIHGSGTQDLREMGGLWRRMPYTAATWIVGVLALAGIPPLAGFFSKDEVIASVLHASPVAGWVLVAASILTGLYAARATRLAFFGMSRSTTPAHESPWSMKAPLIVLAMPAALAGFAGAAIAAALGHEAEPIQLGVAAISVLAALGGVVVGWFVWSRDPYAESSFSARFEKVWLAARSGYAFDAFVERFVIKPVYALSHIAYAAIDRIVIDGFVEGVGRVSSRVGEAFSRIQSGDVQWYGAVMGAGIVVLITVALLVGR